MPPNRCLFTAGNTLGESALSDPPVGTVGLREVACSWLKGVPIRIPSFGELRTALAGKGAGGWLAPRNVITTTNYT